jgi:N-acetylneuraminic acid mutarotase
MGEIMKKAVCSSFVAFILLAGSAEAIDYMEDWTRKFPSTTISGRVSHAMAHIGGDRVILFGGYDGDYDGETWVYNLSSNKLSLKITTSKPSPRRYHAMASFTAGIAEDQVILFGGYDGDYDDETWIYDLVEDTWTQVFPDSFPSARHSHAMAYIGSDKVLLFGGKDDSGYYNDTWVYDLSETSWTQLSPPSPPSARRNHAMADIGVDQVLLFGGWDGTDDDETWIFDLNDTTWIQVFPDSFPSARRYHDIADIDENRVLLFGGYDGADDDETWVYDLVDTTWTQLSPPSQPSARDKHAMAYIGSDKVLLFGGHDGTYDDETWVYDLSAITWTQKSPTTQPAGRYVHAMACIGEDQVLLFGGNVKKHGAGGGIEKNGETWLYDLGENIWTYVPTDPSPLARAGHTMAYLGEGQVLLFGGGDIYQVSDETWRFDLSDCTWTQVISDSIPSARYSHAMAYIGEGQVLLFGGYSPSSRINYNDTWRYTLGENTWSKHNPANSPSARIGPKMAYIGGGKVLLFGGSTGPDETWVFDLGENNWTNLSGPSRPPPRGGHAMAYIGGDNVVMFGGARHDTLYTDTWIYDLSDTLWERDHNTISPASGDHSDISETSMDGSSFPILFSGELPSGAFSDTTWTFGGGDYLPVPDPPQVTVTYPNGGEILADSATITWTATDPDLGDSSLLLVDLDYSANAGGSWSGIATGEANDGHHFWDISGLADDSTYLVRITATDPTFLSDCDTCDAVFTISNLGPPTAISDLEATLSGSSIHLSWTAVTADTAGKPLEVDLYYIYRDTMADFSPGPQAFDSTADTFYVDTSGAVGDTAIQYYYAVTAVAGGQESACSGQVGEFDRILMTVE